MKKWKRPQRPPPPEPDRIERKYIHGQLVPVKIYTAKPAAGWHNPERNWIHRGRKHKSNGRLAKRG